MMLLPSVDMVHEVPPPGSPEQVIWVTRTTMGEWNRKRRKFNPRNGHDSRYAGRMDDQADDDRFLPDECESDADRRQAWVAEFRRDSTHAWPRLQVLVAASGDDGGLLVDLLMSYAFARIPPTPAGEFDRALRYMRTANGEVLPLQLGTISTWLFRPPLQHLPEHLALLVARMTRLRPLTRHGRNLKRDRILAGIVGHVKHRTGKFHDAEVSEVIGTIRETNIYAVSPEVYSTDFIKPRPSRRASTKRRDDLFTPEALRTWRNLPENKRLIAQYQKVLIELGLGPARN